MPAKIELSVKTIITVLAVIFALWFIYEVRDILILLFIAFILTSAFHPLVEQLEGFRIPRPLAILLLYFVGIVIVGIVASSIVPPLVIESIRLGNQLPQFFSNALSYFKLESFPIDTLSNQFGPIGESLLHIVLNFFSNLLTVITLLVFTFYFLLERQHLEKYLRHVVGKEKGQEIIILIHKIEERLGAWVRGELILMLTIGISSYLGLSLLKVDYALALAIIAGVLEIVPVVGPIVSAIPAIVVALSLAPSPLLAIAVAGLYFIIQQLENHLIVPAVMRKAVDLPPVVTLLALLVGGRLGGIGGAILAIPLVVTMRVIGSELLNLRKA